MWLSYIVMDKHAQNRKKVAERIKTALEERGWSQATLAEKSGISKPRINVILKGGENLTIDTITTLEVALGKKIVEIY